LLTANHWEGAGLSGILSAELEPYAGGRADRIRLEEAAGEVGERGRAAGGLARHRLHGGEGVLHPVVQFNHRVKNTLATVQSMARQTARSAASLADFTGSFEAPPPPGRGPAPRP
jgi:hypothetical protein